MTELIIWDFNGTVLDDVDTTVVAVNSMLKKRSLPCTDRETYIKTLVMPLEKYYETIGIYNIDIHKLSVEFRERTIEHSNLSGIFSDFVPTITRLQQMNIDNILMSSLYEQYLFAEVKKYDLEKYFSDIIGMCDTGVGSKYINALKYITDKSISPENVLFVGDLPSDAQTAQKLGAKCVLVARGHTDAERLKTLNVPVLDSLKDLYYFV